MLYWVTNVADSYYCSLRLLPHPYPLSARLPFRSRAEHPAVSRFLAASDALVACVGAALSHGIFVPSRGFLRALIGVAAAGTDQPASTPPFRRRHSAFSRDAQLRVADDPATSLTHSTRRATPTRRRPEHEWLPTPPAPLHGTERDALVAFQRLAREEGSSCARSAHSVLTRAASPEWGDQTLLVNLRGAGQDVISVRCTRR